MVIATTTAGKAPTLRVLANAPPGQVCYECNRRHRSWRTSAKCMWPSAIWITGNPPRKGPCYALCAYCKPYSYSGLTVTLWADLAVAESRKRMIDNCGCGGGCYRDHRIYALHDGRPFEVSDASAVPHRGRGPAAQRHGGKPTNPATALLIWFARQHEDEGWREWAERLLRGGERASSEEEGESLAEK